MSVVVVVVVVVVVAAAAAAAVCYFFTCIIATIFGRCFIAHLLRRDLSNASSLTEHISAGLGS